MNTEDYTERELKPLEIVDTKTDGFYAQSNGEWSSISFSHNGKAVSALRGVAIFRRTPKQPAEPAYLRFRNKANGSIIRFIASEPGTAGDWELEGGKLQSSCVLIGAVRQNSHWELLPPAPDEPQYALAIDQPAAKNKGSYTARGIIRARFLATDGTPRYVFEFSAYAGLYHIFNEKQLEPAEGGGK